VSAGIAALLTPGAWLVPIVAFAFALGIGLALDKRAHRAREARYEDAEAALRSSEERLRFAVEATTEVVWDWNLAEDTLYHPGWAKVYGHPEEATPRTGGELAPFIHPDDLVAFDAQVKAACAGKRETIEIEHRVRTGSGEWKWMLGRGRVVERDARGEAVRIVGTCADVTERKRMMARLQMADRLASVGTLAAGVAHEINNPLAYVIGNVGCALEALARAEASLASAGAAQGKLSATLAECTAGLREAEDGARRVRDIVRDLKIFSRVQDEQRTRVDVCGVVRTALNLARKDLLSRARLVTRLATVPAVVADESRLSQVFLNLLVNAAQAIPEGHADENRIVVEARTDERGRVVVEVRDSGCGIAPELHQRIFDPFFTTKPVGVGTGLGLAICHGIVTGLGGEIEMESEPGKGTTFRVLLAPAPQDDGAPTLTPAPRPAPRRGRVLVVDDEALFCRTAERILAADHEVTALADPSEAVRRIEKGERFDVVLSDLAMPGMTGIELQEAIARIAPDQAERVLFVTGGAFTEALADFVARRQDRVLEKPLSPDALRAAVGAALERAMHRSATGG
jgi:PAS domain S-box-containing protein